MTAFQTSFVFKADKQTDAFINHKNNCSDSIRPLKISDDHHFPSYFGCLLSRAVLYLPEFY